MLKLEKIISSEKPIVEVVLDEAKALPNRPKAEIFS
jgi:hypothetical protein